MERRFSVGPHHVRPRSGPIGPNDKASPSCAIPNSRAVLGPDRAIDQDHLVFSPRGKETTGSDVSRATPRNHLNGAKRTAWYYST